MPISPNQYVFKLDRRSSSKPGEFFQLMTVAAADASATLPGEIPFKL